MGRTNERRPTRDWLADWLATACQAIPNAEAGLAALDSPACATPACWPSSEVVSPRLAATLDAARRMSQLAVQSPAAAPDPRVSTQVALPVARGGRTVGAVGVSVRGVPPSEVKALGERLGGAVRGLELLLEAFGECESLSDLFTLAGSLLDPSDLREAAHALSGELARRFGCERVTLGVSRRRGIDVLAVSTSPRFAAESDAVRDRRAAMEEAVELDALLERPAPRGAPPQPAHAHETLLRSSGAGTVCSVPLAAQGRAVGALTCEWDAVGALGDALRDRLLQSAALAGPILALWMRAEAGPRERARAWLAKWIDRHVGDRALAGGLAAGLAAAIALLLVLPGSYRIAAPATLEGRVQRALVAAVDGYVAEANARAGDLVTAGTVVARLDEGDFDLEHRHWASQKAQLEQEYREALAGQDRARVSILRARIEQAAARLELAREQLARTTVVAPFDGVVLEGDLDRALGSPVERGDVLFELAPLDGYRIIVEVPGRDVADVAPGQTGRLTLAALPDRALPLVVERVSPIATSAERRSWFRVEAALEEPSEALRPGMEGVAKIDAGRRRLLWIWTHETFDWLRLRAWSLLP